MNPDPEKLRPLLDEVLPSSAEHCGPSRADVLHMLHGERRRRHRHAGAAALAIVAVTLASLLWPSRPPASTPIAHAPTGPAPLVIRNVNDEQFFAILQGTPTAMMEWPNGERTLFIIEH